MSSSAVVDPQQWPTIMGDMLKAFRTALDNQPKSDAPIDISKSLEKDGKKILGARNYLREHPLGPQRDRLVGSGGLSAKDPVFTHAENSACFLSGRDSEYFPADSQAKVPAGDYSAARVWPCIMTPNAQLFGNQSYFDAMIVDGGNPTVDESAIGGVFLKKADDGSDCKWMVNQIQLRGGEDEESQAYYAHQNLIPSFPFAKVTKKDGIKMAVGKDSNGKDVEYTFKKDEYAPDVVGFYLQWASCSKVILEMLCDEGDDEFCLPDGIYLRDAFQGYVDKMRKWWKKTRVDAKTTYKPVTANPQPAWFLKQGEPGSAAKAADPETVLGDSCNPYAGLKHLKDMGFPAARDSYVFVASKAPVVCDEEHPLAVGNLNAHYTWWMMKMLDREHGRAYPTMSMIRTYSMCLDRFQRATRSMASGGYYHEFPAKPLLMRRGKREDFKTDRDAVDEALGRFNIPDQLAFLARYIFDTATRVKRTLRAAAGVDSGKKTDLKRFQAAVDQLVKEEQNYLFLFMDYASRIASKMAEAEEKKWGEDEELKGPLKGYEVFADPVYGEMLSVTIANGTWVTHTLFREPKKMSSSARAVTDADVQLILAAADKKDGGLDKNFMRDLQAQIAHQHDNVFASAAILDGMCRGIKGKTIEIYDVRTNQPIPSRAWSFVADDKGNRRIEISDPKFKAKWEAGELVPDCKHLLMLYTDDVKEPQVLPHPPMSEGQVMRFLERAASYTKSNSPTHVFMKIQKKYQALQPSDILTLVNKAGIRGKSLAQDI